MSNAAGADDAVARHTSAVTAVHARGTTAATRPKCHRQRSRCSAAQIDAKSTIHTHLNAMYQETLASPPLRHTIPVGRSFS